MEFIEINDPKEYEEFVKNSNKSHFMQSFYWGEVMKMKKFEPHYLILKNDDRIVASALMLKKFLIKGYCYYYIPRGYILDYSNKDLIKIFSLELKKYAKKNKGIFIKIDPDIKLHDLDLDGNITGNDNSELVDYLVKLGYKHLGFYKSFTHEQPRFTFRLNLNRSFDEIYGGMHATTRKILNKKNQFNLNIYKGSLEDIDAFYETMKETAKREGLYATSIDYYRNFYEVLNKHNMSDLYVVKVNIDDLKTTYNDKINEIEAEISKINEIKNEKKKNNLLQDLNNKLAKAKIELENIAKIDKKEIVLSSIMTAKYADKVWTIHGGNSTLLRELNSNYLLYFKIIEDAYNEGYKMIDFFGTSGEANPNKDNPIYGIHNFKKRLGGEYTEFIGEFDYVTNKFMYFMYNKLVPIYRKIKIKK